MATPSCHLPLPTLQTIRTKHGMSQASNTPIAKSLQTISSLLKQDTHTTATNTTTNTLMNALKAIMGCVVQDVSSASIELGRQGGVSLLIQMAMATSSNHPNEHPPPVDVKCCAFALNILSAASSHQPFVVDFAKYMDQPKLAHLVVEACSSTQTTTTTTTTSCTNGTVLDVAAAAISLMLHLCIHLLEQETTSHVQSSSHSHHHFMDGTSICRMCNAALASSDLRCQQSALDLLATWTATDLDSLAKAVDAADVYTNSKQNHRSKK